VAARLAALQLKHVEQLILATQHQVVEAQQDLPPAGVVALTPGLLRGPRPLDGQVQVLGPAARDRPQHVAGGRVLDLHLLPIGVGDGDLCRQRREGRRAQARGTLVTARPRGRRDAHLRSRERAERHTS